MQIRRAHAGDEQGIWQIIEPMIREGETCALPREMDQDQAVAFWLGGDHTAYVAEDNGRLVGTYYIRPNQRGGGSHIANAGYVTAADCKGRGIARRMGEHSLEMARQQGYRAMQFNIVVATNAPAVHLWQSLGFKIIGTLPGVFQHPTLGYVDAHVMFRTLTQA